MPKSDQFHRIDQYEEYTRSYDVRYIAEITHTGLGTFRVLKDLDKGILQRKIESQFLKWDEQWEKIDRRQKDKLDREFNENYVEERNREIKAELRAIEDLLIDTLEVDDTINWDTLKDVSPFAKPNPQKQVHKALKAVRLPVSPVYIDSPPPPTEELFRPKLHFFDKIIKSIKEKKLEEFRVRFLEVTKEWEEECRGITARNAKISNEFEQECAKIEEEKAKIVAEYARLETKWLEEKKQFEEQQMNNNQLVEKLRADYLQGEANAVVEYCELVLNNSVYPESFSKNFEIEYNPTSKILIVEYSMPTIDLFPKVLEVKYYAAKKEIKEILISEAQRAKIYDEAIYKITLRTLHELFEADSINALNSIVFNGWVKGINKGTGKASNNCILSIHVNKYEFVEIDLSLVDPKSCFKSLKGVGSSKLSSLTPIKPLLQISKEDKRFVSSRDIVEGLNDTTNLAAMSWEDFEHLIRELFEKEFKSNGGEVKVTQASRDGGVDAVAFDPDPLRGGKIVIQAKRYTNTVGVSAVRDLYGTVLNEGASKGILVTTSDFGPDAYEFVRNKPLTLLSGNNLLYLLEKHGQKARINLLEAKQASNASSK